MCLHGCGCDEGDAVKCSTSYGSSSGSDSCKALEDFVSCIDSAGCCDYEQEGTKMSEVLDTTIALFNLVCMMIWRFFLCRQWSFELHSLT